MILNAALKFASHCTKNEVFHKVFFGKCDQIRRKLKEILNVKLHFLRCVSVLVRCGSWIVYCEIYIDIDV